MIESQFITIFEALLASSQRRPTSVNPAISYWLDQMNKNSQYIGCTFRAKGTWRDQKW